MRCNEFNDDLLDQIIYRGEGNSSIVVALKNKSKVIRLLKKDGKIMKTSQDHHVTQHPMRSIRFIHLIMKPLTSPYLSDRTELVHLKSDFVSMLSKKVEVERPPHRLDKTLHLDDQYALVMDDLCTLPEHLINGMTEKDFLGPTISVEIKPKQGFLAPSHRLAMKSSINDQMTSRMKGSCLYGLNQYLKLARGRIKETSNYCPINLFSGCPVKMRGALEALLRNPQNNLRIFKNLTLAYDENNRPVLSDLFDDNTKTFSDGCCATDYENSTFARNKDLLIELLIQCLLSEPSIHDLNSQITWNGNHSFVDGKDNENLFSATSASGNCEHHDSIFDTSYKCCDSYSPSSTKKHRSNLMSSNVVHKLPQRCVLASVLKAQKLDSIGAFEARHMLEWLLDDANHHDDKIDILEELSKPQMPPGFGSPCQLPSESKRDYFFRKVWEFLVSLTAKDCSIITTLRQITQERYESLLFREPEASGHLLRDEVAGGYYMFSVGIADFDQKMPLKILRICENLSQIMIQSK